MSFIRSYLAIHDEHTLSNYTSIMFAIKCQYAHILDKILFFLNVNHSKGTRSKHVMSLWGYYCEIFFGVFFICQQNYITKYKVTPKFVNFFLLQRVNLPKSKNVIYTTNQYKRVCVDMILSCNHNLRKRILSTFV